MFDYKERVEGIFNNFAGAYDNIWEKRMTLFTDMLIRDVQVPENPMVLDVGCGTGLLFKHLLNKVKSTVGVDISRGLLGEARKRMHDRQDISLVQADADNLPFKEKAFNSVFAVTLVQNTPNVDNVLNEIKRVSTQKATIVVTGLKKKFTSEDFLKMLGRAGLKVETLKMDSQNREYVCICRKTWS